MNPAKSASNRHRRETYKTVQDSDVVLEGDDRVSWAESDPKSTTDTLLVQVLPQELPRHVPSGLQSAAHRRLSPLQGPRAGPRPLRRPRVRAARAVTRTRDDEGRVTRGRIDACWRGNGNGMVASEPRAVLRIPASGAGCLVAGFRRGLGVGGRLL